jgi:hypothetical protein
VFMRRHQGTAAGNTELDAFLRSLAWAVAFGKAREEGFGIIAVNNVEVGVSSLKNAKEGPET